MNRLIAILLLLTLVSPAHADMYPDASNATLPVARTNLGLGTMAVQNAPAVAITGGTISNVTLGNISTLGVGAQIQTLNAATNYSPTLNFTAPSTTTGAALFNVQGSIATPDSTLNPLVIFEKFANSADSDPTINATVAVMMKRYGDTPNAHATGLYVESNDIGGWSGVGQNSFTEGIHGVAVGVGANSSVQGMIATAGGTSGVGYTSLTGIESQVFNVSGTDAATAFNHDHSAAAFIATSGVQDPNSKKADAGFMINPYIGFATDGRSQFRRGFYCPTGARGAGQALSPISDSCFSDDATTVIGLDMSRGSQSFASIAVPNGGQYRALNAAGSTLLAIMWVDSSNELILGNDTVSTVLVSQLILGTVPTSAGGGGLTLCVDTGGKVYKKATCP